ncbi:MAG: hypothetical protein JF597_32715 [Streptomyces sp.]|uniref:hypothetical protein n=1 Tax=Streptomyces sp. TaxID=1931 RepID=UPI0025CF008B|nr:hypothetical protein [Streptomyces sp.]MBW8798178.1 hypothetical protein [Streptomyces sp.]
MFGVQPAADLGEHAVVAASRRPGPPLGLRRLSRPGAVRPAPALIEGRVQAQSLTDTPDHEVTRSCAGAALPSPPWPVEVTDDERSTVLTAADGGALRLHRALAPTAPDTRPETAAGQVSGAWEAADGTRARAVVAPPGRWSPPCAPTDRHGADGRGLGL